ncbi:hypothetical protein DPMN_170053 [Dreissena polymorpha]|uniref:CUB domain-containing protein n=2 Tax=Dreissena polymorpha TaxID=45954 RepID=A0A9D4DVH9_DREPO|nr:hypothetical protein DPMN_170053 [Dreissena polymorpha]
MLAAQKMSDSVARSYSLCHDDLVQIGQSGEQGTIYFTSAGRPISYCVLRFQACSRCRLLITAVISRPFSFDCRTTTDMNDNLQCNLGCDYLHMFDKDYKSNKTAFIVDMHNSIRFESESSEMFIGICATASSYSFTLNYTSKEKLVTRMGTVQGIGSLQSPFFPSPYATNYEVYRYSITGPVGSYITLMFKDWNLAESSSFYFPNSNFKMLQVTGTANRPYVQSDFNKLDFLFQTGVAGISGENRNYIGFSLQYNITTDWANSFPVTACDSNGYYLNSVGGVFEFRLQSTKVTLFDCLWVLKRQPGYDFLNVKIEKFKTHNQQMVRTENTLEILDGITSDSSRATTFDLLDNVDNAAGISLKHGAYIRYTGHFEANNILTVVYNSYTVAKSCISSQFRCDSGNCIHRSLVCDKVNHCGDRSDEGERGCSGDIVDPQKSYQYTITIGVIIPMVISVFLVMIICLLFVMIRKCRQAQQLQEQGSMNTVHRTNEEVGNNRPAGRFQIFTSGRRRRHRRRHYFGGDLDQPPPYDEAMKNPPGYHQNVTFGDQIDPSRPQPPPYTATADDATEVIVGNQPHLHSQPHTQTSPHPYPHPQGSSSSTFSSESEFSRSEFNLGSGCQSSDSSSSSDGETPSGGYDPDGDGRRERVQRNRSSSGSEISSGLRQQRVHGHSEGYNHGHSYSSCSDKSDKTARSTVPRGVRELEQHSRKPSDKRRTETKPGAVVSENSVQAQDCEKYNSYSAKESLKGTSQTNERQPSGRSSGTSPTKSDHSRPMPAPAKRKGKHAVWQKDRTSVDSGSENKNGFQSQPQMSRTRSEEVLTRGLSAVPSIFHSQQDVRVGERMSVVDIPVDEGDVLVVYDKRAARGNMRPGHNPGNAGNTTTSSYTGNSRGRGRPVDQSTTGSGTPVDQSSTGRGRPVDQSTTGSGKHFGESTTGMGRPVGQSSTGRGRPVNKSTTDRGRPSDQFATGSGRPVEQSTIGRDRPGNQSTTGSGRPVDQSITGLEIPVDQALTGRGRTKDQSITGSMGRLDVVEGRHHLLGNTRTVAQDKSHHSTTTSAGPEGGRSAMDATGSAPLDREGDRGSVPSRQSGSKVDLAWVGEENDTFV